MEKTLACKDNLTFFDHLTLSAVHISLAAFFLSLASQYSIFGTFHFAAALIPGLLIFVGYAFDNISGVSEEDKINKPKRYLFKKKYGTPCLAVAFVVFIGVVTFSFLHSVMLGIAVLIPEIAVIPYGVNLEKYKIPRIKKIVVLKNVYTVSLWVFALIVIPLIYLNQPLNKLSFVVMFQLFVILLIDAVTCDIEDIDGDIKAGVKTIPSFIGRNYTLILGLSMNTLSILCFFVFFSSFLNTGLTVMFAANLYTYIYLFYYLMNKNSKIRNDYIDVVLMIPSIALVILKILKII